MSRTAPARRAPAKRRRRFQWPPLLRWVWSRVWPKASTRRWLGRLFRTSPVGIRLAVIMLVASALWLVANGVYQVTRKPTELYFPVSGVLYKLPAETWRTYGSIFREHATSTITPAFLAALAQIEGSGNPLVRTYWEWSASWNPFEWYRPASSAVGMYQIIDGTFLEARRYCIHNHAVVEDGPWNDLGSCWFNGLYTRVVPTHSVEMTSALLDRRVVEVLARRNRINATLQQKQDLAAVIHLCGVATGDAFAKRGFRLSPGQRCGAHEVQTYVAKIRAMRREFIRLEVLAATAE